MPLVSIIIPNYNHGRFLRERLDSVLNQKLQDFELIILDDASTDNSREIIQSYASRPKVTCFFNDQNSGSPFVQWRRGLQAARGEYIWIAESDDYAAETLLEKLVNLFGTHSNVGLAYCQTYDVTEGGEVFGTAEEWAKVLDPVRWSRDFVSNGPEECARYLAYRNVIVNASAVLVRKALIQSAIQEACGYRMAGDWFVWAKCLSQADVAFLAEPLNFHRHHSNTVRSTTSRLELALECARVKSWIIENLPVERRIRRDIARESFLEVRQFSGDLRGRQMASWLRIVLGQIWPLHRWLVFRLCARTLWEIYGARARQFWVRGRIRAGAARRRIWEWARALVRE